MWKHGHEGVRGDVDRCWLFFRRCCRNIVPVAGKGACQQFITDLFLRVRGKEILGSAPNWVRQRGVLMQWASAACLNGLFIVFKLCVSIYIAEQFKTSKKRLEETRGMSRTRRRRGILHPAAASPWGR